jgi:long-chain acyl-CoA synthetase
MPIAGPPLDGPVNLPEILKLGLDTKPDVDALVSRRRRWTWRMLDIVSTRLASNYLDLGLAPGDRVASLMPNRTELMVHYLACMKCGLVAMPLNYRYMAPEINHALEVSGAKILLAHDERRQDLAASKLAGKLPLGQLSYDDNGGHGDLTFRSHRRHDHRRLAPDLVADMAENGAAHRTGGVTDGKDLEDGEQRGDLVFGGEEELDLNRGEEAIHSEVVPVRSITAVVMRPPARRVQALAPPISLASRGRPFRSR